MPREAVFTLKLEPELRDPELMRDYIEQQRTAREHDAWFRAEIEQGLREADDPAVRRISNEDVVADWQRHRAEIIDRAR